jgi:hypothetical protein
VLDHAPRSRAQESLSKAAGVTATPEEQLWRQELDEAADELAGARRQA